MNEEQYEYLIGRLNQDHKQTLNHLIETRIKIAYQFYCRCLVDCEVIDAQDFFTLLAVYEEGGIL